MNCGRPTTAAERDYAASAIYSDDSGRSWSWGGAAPDDAGLGLDEARIAQQATGDVIVNSATCSSVEDEARYAPSAQ